MIDWLMLATCPNYDGQVTNENRQMFLTSSVSPWICSGQVLQFNIISNLLALLRISVHWCPRAKKEFTEIDE